MTASFTRRLVLLSTLAFGGVFAVLVAATALLAFSLYVSALESDIHNEVADVRAYVTARGLPIEAHDLAQVIATRLYHARLTVIVLDPDVRATVRGRNSVEEEPRNKLLPPSPSNGPIARVSLALATLFGLSPARVQFADVALIVRASEAAMSDAVQRFLPVFLFAELLACIVGFMLARLLTHEALRPLVAVNAALNRFAAGDLTPQLVSESDGGDLAALARAYNGAVAEMARALTERERAQAAMHQFISDAGHQLKTPLTVIRGFIGLLRKGDLRSAQDYQRILATMNRQSMLMAEMIEKLILLERWERTEPQPQSTVIDVAQLVEDVVTPLLEAQPARTMSLEIAAGASAAIDPSDFAHAVTNLVDNAIKYTDGTIGVRVSKRGERVLVDISDEGPGMTRDELGHAFDRFYRGATRRDIDGAGLGLAIAKRAVERAGGSIEARSEPDGGSCFTIVLPAYRAA
ncbi:MAG: HAMP domain-containing histidine kinase [Candidatus Eremiobacteraeota bacterium]|nr:HAMP domain-containing histidine kinase [Candidatus Eremiobacteraeota bacterium]MBV9646438.1 HAMP domain-containing histidine kinase [Candidatus Eremiobacteraeota bacterium]